MLRTVVPKEKKIQTGDATYEVCGNKVWRRRNSWLIEFICL